MHVLGMPPAFVLSQDQTLKLTSDANSNPDPERPEPEPPRMTRASSRTSSSELLQMRGNESSMGAQTHPQSRRPRIPSFSTFPRTQRPEPEGPDREKPAKGRKTEAFLAFAGARLIGWAKGPVKPISVPHSTPARKPHTAVPARQGRTVAKPLTDSDRPPPVRRRPELNYRHGVG